MSFRISSKIILNFSIALFIISAGFLLFPNSAQAAITCGSTIVVTGGTEGSPYDFEDVYVACPAEVSKQGTNQFLFNAHLDIGDGSTETWFADTSKLITYPGTSTFIKIMSNGHFRIGEAYDAVNKLTRSGCMITCTGGVQRVIHLDRTGVLEIYSSIIDAPNAQFYTENIGSQINYIWNTIWKGHSPSAANGIANINIYNVRIEHAISGILSIGAQDKVTISSETTYGGFLAEMPDKSGVNGYNIYGSAYDFFIYMCGNSDIYIDNTQSWHGDNWLTLWISSVSSVYRRYSYESKAVDSNGAGLSGLLLKVRNKQGDLVVDVVSNPDGYFGRDYGTAESGTATTLTDTDKSWTTDEWKNAFVKITSGTGEGQERQIVGNTATALTVGVDWDTNPDSTSKYYVYPMWLNHGYFPATNTEVWETPHLIQVKKYGKKVVTAVKLINTAVTENLIVEDNPFITLSESAAGALTGITYTAPTKVTFPNESHTNYTTSGTLSNFPVVQSEFFAVYGYDGTDDGQYLSRVTGTPSADGEFSINYETGVLTFYNNQSGHTVNPVYSYGGSIVLDNDIGSANELTLSEIYDYMQAQYADVFTTIDGITYNCYVDFQIGDAVTAGSINDSTKLISMADGFDYSFGTAGGYLDLYGITGSSGGSGGATAQEIWEYNNRGLTTFGTLASDVASAVWGYSSGIGRRLTSLVVGETETQIASKATLDDIKESQVGFTGTADSGLTTTLVDNALTQADDFWNGMTLVITAGTNVGEIRQIEDFDAASDTITVKTAFTSVIDGTSEYLIRREMNWAERVWNWNTRSLTAFGDLAADVWDTTYSGVRKLTSRQIGEEASEHIAQEENVGSNVWNYTGSITNNLIQNLGDTIWNSYTGVRKLTSRQIGDSVVYIPGVTESGTVTQVADKITQDDIEYDVELVRKATFDFAGLADSGTTLTLVDSELVHPNDHWNDYELWMMSGNNIGLKRAICDFDKTSNTITLCGNALAQPIASGDQYVISHERKLVHAIWNWTDRQLNGVGNIASAVWGWTGGQRQLTSQYTDEGTPVDLAQVADVSNLATSAELAQVRTDLIAEINENEVLLAALNDITAQDVWEYGTRDLTDYSTSTIAQASADEVWNKATTVLTGTGSIGKLLVDNIDSTISSRGTSDLTAAEVWSESTRTLTDYATSSIALAVWNNAQRTLTSYGNDITAADVWNVLSDTLVLEDSIGKQLADNVNATISSRASQESIDALNNISATDVWAVSTRGLTTREIGPDEYLASEETLTGGSTGGLTIETHTVSQFFQDQEGTAVVMVKNNGVPVSGATVLGDYYKPDDTVFLSNQAFTEIGITGTYRDNFDIPADADEGVYKLVMQASQTTGGTNFSDTFTEPDGPASNWSPFGDWAIESNIYKANMNYSSGRSVLDDASALDWQDYTFEADVRRDSDQNYALSGIAGRWQDTNTNYWFFMQPADNTVRFQGSGLNESASYTFDVGVWYRFKMVFSGNNIKCYVNDVEVIDATDATPIENGKIALKTQNFGASFDNVSVVVSGTTLTAHIAKDFKVEAHSEYMADISASDIWTYSEGDGRKLTTAGVDEVWEYALTQIGETGSVGKLLKDNINASVSSRSSHTAADIWDVTERTLTSNANFNDPDSATIAAAVWDATTKELTNYGNDITAADVWNVLSANLTTNGSIGKQLADNVDTAVSTRSTSKTWVGAVGIADDGSPATLIDNALTQADDFWNGMSLIITTGTNIGEVRQIQDFDAVSDTITVATAFTSAIDDTSEYIIRREYIGTPDDLSNNLTLFDRIKDIRTKLDQLDTLETKLDTVDGIIDNIRASQQLNYTAELSDVGKVETTKTYRAKLSVWDYENNPANASTTPTIIIYDASRATADTGSMTELSTGVYEYTYVVSSGATCGLWESVVSIDLGGSSALTLNDYWEVEGSPAQVIINSMSDTTAPSISANVTISNEGNSGYEYQYEWCVVTSQDNQCGGGDDIDYASAAKYLNVGEDYTANLSATVSDIGDYWFKVVVYYGTEASGASRTFTAIEEEEEEETPPGGGGGGTTPVNLSKIYSKLLEVQNELGYHDTQRTAYKDLANTKYSLGILPDQVSDPLYTILSGVSSNIKAMGGDKGYNLDDLYYVSQTDSGDLKYIVNKTAELKAVIDVNKSLISTVANQPIIKTWWEEGSIILKIMAVNPLDANFRTITVKEYLPKEIRSEHIIEVEQGLQLEYDSELDSYFVFGEIELGPGERKTFAIKAEDVFKISEDELNSLKEQSDTLMAPLQGTSYFAQASILKSEIDANINGILRQQKGQPTNIEKRILIFRDNQKDLQEIKENIESLKIIVSEASGKGGVFGSLFGVSTTMTWAIIIIVVVGIVVLMILLYAILAKNRALEYHISGGKRLKTPPMVDVKKQARKIKGGLITYFLPPFGKPVVDLRQMIKMIKILIVVGVVVVLILLGFRFAPKLFSKTNSEIKITNNTASVSATITHTEEKKEILAESNFKTIKILETETGRLRVRSAPSFDGEILTTIPCREKCEYLNQKDGWYQIPLDIAYQSSQGPLKTGWVFGEYIEIISNFND